MTKAIILNTLTGAVSEYTGFGFQSITPTHAGSATGLFALGGDSDAGHLIVSNVVTGRLHWGDTRKKFLGMVYFTLKGSGINTLTVQGENSVNSYTFSVRPAGQSRAKPGLGIRENYLSFGYSNTNGADFDLDRIEVAVIKSNNRRV